MIIFAKLPQNYVLIRLERLSVIGCLWLSMVKKVIKVTKNVINALGIASQLLTVNICQLEYSGHYEDVQLANNKCVET